MLRCLGMLHENRLLDQYCVARFEQVSTIIMLHRNHSKDYAILAIYYDSTGISNWYYVGVSLLIAERDLSANCAFLLSHTNFAIRVTRWPNWFELQ